MKFEIGGKIHVTDKENCEDADGEIIGVSLHLTNPKLYDVDYKYDNGHTGHKCVDSGGFCVHCNATITEV